MPHHTLTHKHRNSQFHSPQRKQYWTYKTKATCFAVIYFCYTFWPWCTYSYTHPGNHITSQTVDHRPHPMSGMGKCHTHTNLYSNRTEFSCPIMGQLVIDVWIIWIILVVISRFRRCNAVGKSKGRETLIKAGHYKQYNISIKILVADRSGYNNRMSVISFYDTRS